MTTGDIREGKSCWGKSWACISLGVSANHDSVTRGCDFSQIAQPL